MASYNLVVIGVAGSGKSCITIRFIANRFVGEYDPTLEDSYRRQFNVDDIACVLDIFDTAGTDDFAQVRDGYIRQGEGFLCVYAIDDEKSFKEVIKLYDHVARVKDVQSTALPFVLVGNKTDLESYREVSFDRGRGAADMIHASFFETSALTGKNVTEAFHELARLIRRARINGVYRAPEDDEEIKKIKKKIKKGKCRIF